MPLCRRGDERNAPCGDFCEGGRDIGGTTYAGGVRRRSDDNEIVVHHIAAFDPKPVATNRLGSPRMYQQHIAVAVAAVFQRLPRSDSNDANSYTSFVPKNRIR